MQALAKTAAEWLAPFLAGKTKLSEIGADDLGAALDALLPWNLKRRLEEEAPTHFEAPTGNRHAIDYETAGAPALHIRVQELFGLTQHPSIANGKLPLTLHLLSPAHRPIQITRDLPGFWKGSWAAVKAEMKGPLSAPPLARRSRLGSSDRAGQAARDVTGMANATLGVAFAGAQAMAEARRVNDARGHPIARRSARRCIPLRWCRRFRTPACP